MASLIDKYLHAIRNAGGKPPADYKDDPRDMQISKLDEREDRLENREMRPREPKTPKNWRR